MKLIYVLFLAALPCCAQVGIGTNAPSATLDIVGNLRVRSIPAHSDSTFPKDSILVADANGNFQRTSAKKIISSHLQSFVRGGYSATSDQSLTMSSGSAKILFDYKEFDENDEYDIANHFFKAKADGIYAVSVQIKATSALGIATNFGVGIAKNGTIVAKQGFANVGVAFVNITPRCEVFIRS